MAETTKPRAPKRPTWQTEDGECSPLFYCTGGPHYYDGSFCTACWEPYCAACFEGHACVRLQAEATAAARVSEPATQGTLFSLLDEAEAM